MAMIASRISAVPWSLTAHRSDIVGNNLLRDKARSATMVRAISVGGKRMLARFGVPEASVRVIPIGVRIPSAAALDCSSKAVVLCPADLLEVKGHKFLLQAWRILLDRGICGELWLAGTGHLRPALRKLACKLEIQSSAFFLGTLSHTALLQHYAHSRISCVVLASIDLGAGCHEGIPVSLVEAMSYGVPVVATSTGSIPELVEPDTGFLVPPCDPNALADSIETLLRHSQLARQIGANAHRHVAGTRNVVAIAAALETHFQAQLRTDLCA